MKRQVHFRPVAPRRGTILGLLVLFLAFAMMGGADPAQQVEDAREAKAQVEAASQGEPVAAPEGEPVAAAPEGVEPVAEPTESAEAAGPAEAPAVVEEGAPEAAAQGEVDYVDFAEGEGAEDSRMQSRREGGTELITVALDNVSLEDAVRMFAQTTGANIISSGSLLEGKRVTINLKDVDWRPALRSILEINGLSLVEQVAESGVYSIQTQVPDAPEPTVVKTFFLDYTTAGEIKESIKGMLKANAILTTFPSRNALVIRSTEGNLTEVKKLIEELDKPGRQVLIEAKIMELSDTASKALGIDWSMLSGYKVGMTGMKWQMSDARQRDHLDRQTDLGYALQTSERGSLQYYDQDGEEIPSLSVDTKTWGAQPGMGTFETSSGTESGWQSTPTVLTERTWDGTPSAYSESVQAVGSADQSLVERISNDMYDDLKTAILSPADFSLVLSALETMDGVSVVSNPKMIVTSGATNAFFSIGQRDPIIKSEIQRGTTENPGSTIIANLDTEISTDFIQGGYLKTGIDLGVIATVKTEDYIEAYIHPSLRRVIEYTTVYDPETQLPLMSVPRITLKEIGTSFTLRSGQTVAIGGLTDTQDQKVTKRVPFLGSIPLLGRLFRHEETVKSQVETIIFVTLSVADPEKLQENSGIPEDARLVHRQRRMDRAEQAELKQELEAQDATDRSTEEESLGRVLGQSSMFSFIRYVPESGNLFLRLRDGQALMYFRVPQATYEQLVASPYTLETTYQAQIQGKFKSLPADKGVVAQFKKWSRHHKEEAGDVRVVDSPAPAPEPEAAPAAVPAEEGSAGAPTEGEGLEGGPEAPAAPEADPNVPAPAPEASGASPAAVSVPTESPVSEPVIASDEASAAAEAASSKAEAKSKKKKASK